MLENIERACNYLTHEALAKTLTRREMEKAGVAIGASAALSVVSPGIIRAAEPDWLVATYTPERNVEWDPIFDATAQKYKLLQLYHLGGVMDKLAQLTQRVYPHRSYPETALEGAQRVAKVVIPRDANNPFLVESDGLCQGEVNGSILDPQLEVFSDDDNILGTGIGFTPEEKDALKTAAYAACWPDGLALDQAGIQFIIDDFRFGTNGKPPNRVPFAGNVSLKVGEEFWATWLDAVSSNGRKLRGKDTLGRESVAYDRDVISALWRPNRVRVNPENHYPENIAFQADSQMGQIWLNTMASLYNWGIDWDLLEYVLHRENRKPFPRS